MARMEQVPTSGSAAEEFEALASAEMANAAMASAVLSEEAQAAGTGAAGANGGGTVDVSTRAEAASVADAAQDVLRDSQSRGGSIRMQGVDKIYPGSKVKALNNFNLDVKPGEMVVLLGGSGCGKSTALRSLAGLEDIQRGVIMVGGKDITGLPVNKRNMAMVFQSYSLFPHLTALENVEFGLQVRKVEAERVKRVALEKLALVGLLEQADKYPQHMSGGQQQRVALARALAIEPRVLLLDEPLSALDAKVRVQLREEIRSIQLKTGTTTVFVTHDQEEALAVADRIGVMNHGRIEQIAKPRDLYERPETEYVASFIGLSNRIPAISNGEEAIVFGQRMPLLANSIKGEHVRVLVRPEALTLERVFPEGGLDNYRSSQSAGELGRVDTVHFLGSIARVDVMLGSDAMRRENHGDAVSVTVQLPISVLRGGISAGDDVLVKTLPIAALAV